MNLNAGPIGGNHPTGLGASGILGGSIITVGGSVNLLAAGAAGGGSAAGANARIGGAGINTNRINIEGTANVTAFGGSGGNGFDVQNNVGRSRGANGAPGLTGQPQGQINVRNGASLTAAGGNGGNASNIMLSNTQPGGGGGHGIYMPRGDFNIEDSAAAHRARSVRRMAATASWAAEYLRQASRQ